MSGSSALLPCPFCGGSEIYVSTLEDGTRIICRNDECDVSVQTFTKNTEAEAGAAWNTRAPDAALHAVLKEQT